MEGKFTQAEVEKILANGGILIAVAEVATELSLEEVGVHASATDVRHPDTNDVLYVSTVKNYWSPNVDHSAYAGPPGGATYARIKLRTLSFKSDNTQRYNHDHFDYNKDNISDSHNIGLCCYGGGYALTEAWFKSHQGNETFAGGAWLNL